MAVLQKGNVLYPFWGDSVNFIKGLDPLRLQVASEAIYSTLLPGVTNLTNKIRYYGFYCWLIDLYFKKEKKGNRAEQNRFIRRAELMIAIIMQSKRPDVTQITGSLFASNLVKENPTVYDLAAGADKDGSNKAVYWKHSSGAFGQYYYGAMSALSLVGEARHEKGEVIFSVIDKPYQKVSGKGLAQAFDSGLTEEVRALFYDCIKRGKLSHEEIQKLIDYFSIDKVPTDSKEWELYVEMLCDIDYPGFLYEGDKPSHRRNTIRALIASAVDHDNEYGWKIYMNNCYKRKFSNKNDTDIGWYCYRLNEYWQFACTLIFQGALEYLESIQHEEYLQIFIDDFSTLIVNEFEVEQSISLEELFLFLKEEEETVAEKGGNRKNSPQLRAKCGIELLLITYNNNKEHIEDLKSYFKSNRYMRSGDVTEGLSAIDNHVKLQLKDFVSYFIYQRILYRHHMVAIEKRGNGTEATNKFIIEDQIIRLVDIFEAQWTSPRMRALENLLVDLQVIDEYNRLTETHMNLLIYCGD